MIFPPKRDFRDREVVRNSP